MSEIKVGDYVRTYSCTGIVVKIEKGTIKNQVEE
jgi:hypothetical protein